MALTEDDVVAESERDLREIDTSVDVTKGPLKRFYIDPLARPLTRARNKVDRLVGLFTLQRDLVITNAELEAQVSAWSGMSRKYGEPAYGYVTMYFFTDPGVDVQISTGDQVSDESGELIYFVTQDVTIPRSDFERFFNPITRRFEVQVPVQAVEAGSKYAVSAFKITKLVTRPPYIAGVINNSDIADGGTDVETNSELNSRFSSRLEGSELGMQGGLASELMRLSGVKDVAIISSVDTKLFSRRSYRPALDVYIIGTKSKTDVFVPTSAEVTGKNTYFKLPSHRILKVSKVTVQPPNATDATAVSFKVVKDPSVYQGSVKETVTVQLDPPVSGLVPPPPGSIVEITYDYNALLETVQTKASTLGEAALFGTDILVYEAKPVEILIDVEIGILSSFSTASTVAGAREVSLKELNPKRFIGSYLPETYRNFLQRNLTVAASITLNTFRRADNSTEDVQALSFARNEYPILLFSGLKVTSKI